MKTTIALLLTVLTAHAQTITNGQVLTFTNLAGRAYESVRVERIDPHGIVWFTSPTVGGFARFADMPADLRLRFGCDALQERAALEAEASRHAAAIVRRATPPAPVAPAAAPEPSDIMIGYGGGSGILQWQQAENIRQNNLNIQLRGAEWRMSRMFR